MTGATGGVAPPGRRAAAIGLGGLLGMVVVLVIRGTTSEYGLLVRGEAGLLWWDAGGIVAGALAVGVCVPLIAGHHVPGLPMRALCVAWALISMTLHPPDASSLIPTQSFYRGLIAAEVLCLVAGVWVTTTACWLVDTRITFPRLYPDSADRPPPKHTSPRDVALFLVPHALLLALGTGAIRYVLPTMADPTLPALMLAVAAALIVHSVQRLRPSRGSIWTAAGVLAGVGVGTWLRAPDTDLPMPQAQFAAYPTQILSCALAVYAGIVARGSASAAPTLPGTRAS